jgi:hypothetical protein
MTELKLMTKDSEEELVKAINNSEYEIFIRQIVQGNNGKWHCFYEEIEEEVYEDDDEEVETSVCQRCKKEFEDYSYGWEDESEKYCDDCKQELRKEGEKKVIEFSKKLLKEEDFILCKNDVERTLYLQENYPELFENKYFDTKELIKRSRALINMQKRKR